MQYIVTAPGTLHAQIVLPASKSISARALIINALGGGNQTLQNLSDCDDTRVLIQALQTLCKGITEEEREDQIFDIGAAGTAMRFLSAFLAVTPGKHILTGSERMKHRPIKPLVDALRQLGASVDYQETEGFPPLRIEGRVLAGGKISLPGTISSQYISALLMIGPCLANGLELQLTGGIISRPYIEMTFALMRRFGIQIDWIAEDRIAVQPGMYRSAQPFCVENDWSGASYWYQMVALSPDPDAEVVLPGLDPDSVQGDAFVKTIFARLGVETEWVSGRVKDSQNIMGTVRIFKKHTAPEFLDYDFVGQPDLAQTLVVTCVLLGVRFHFKGLQSLRIKETDRLNALCCELGKLGYELEERNGCELLWDGRRQKISEEPVFDTYEDHRMALAFAPISLVNGRVRINNPEVVSKSYPQYWEHLKSVGFKIEES